MAEAKPVKKVQVKFDPTRYSIQNANKSVYGVLVTEEMDKDDNVVALVGECTPEELAAFKDADRCL